MNSTIRPPSPEHPAPMAVIDAPPRVPVPQPSKPRFTARDLLSEATAGLLARPGRLALTALGTVLGIAALVSTLGLAKTTSNQVEIAFDELIATKVSVKPEGESRFSFGGSNSNTPSTIPFDAEARITRINGVVAAGTKSPVDVDSALVRSLPANNGRNGQGFSIPVVAASPGLLDAVRGELTTGRWFDHGHNERAEPVAILGPSAANKLEINRIDSLPTVFVGDKPFTVIGVIDDVSREPDLLSALIIPDITAREVYGLEAPREVFVETVVGAARQVSEAIPATLDPVDPSRIQSTPPPEARKTADSVEESVNALFVVLGGVSLLVGALGIANVTLVSVLERRAEIGLRRSLGAAKRHIAMQFLLESTATGLLGGIIGASLGTIITVAYSAYQDWTPVIDSWLGPAAVGLGAVIGLLAGFYPSWRAARIEPIAALRGTG